MADSPKSSDTIATISVNFPIKFTAVVVLVVIGLSGLFFYVTGSLKETVIFLAAASAAGGTVITAYYVAKTLNLYLSQEVRIREREEALDTQGKKERALRYGERWNDPHMYHVRNVCRSVLEPSADDIRGRVAGNETNVIHLLNFFEEVGFSVKQELVDERLLYDQFGGLVPTIWRTLEPWIKDRRGTFHDDKMWEVVEEFSKRWREPR